MRARRSARTSSSSTPQARSMREESGVSWVASKRKPSRVQEVTAPQHLGPASRRSTGSSGPWVAQVSAVERPDRPPPMTTNPQSSILASGLLYGG